MPEGALSTSARKKRQNWLLCLPLETEIKAPLISITCRVVGNAWLVTQTVLILPISGANPHCRD